MAATTAADAINFIATVLCGKDLAGFVEVSAFDRDGILRGAAQIKKGQKKGRLVYEVY